MKKIALTAILVLISIGFIYSCSNDNALSNENLMSKTNTDIGKDPVVLSRVTTFSLHQSRGNNLEKFLSSDTFVRHADFISDRREMDLNTVQYQTVTVDGNSYDFYIVSILKNNSLAGKLEILNWKDTKFLPNGDKYALNYADLSDYDLKDFTGSIELYDLNYDNFLHTRMKTQNGYYTEAEGNGLSQELKDKYAYLTNPNKINNLASRHLCDSNGNGNISFGECYGCITRAIKANSTSTGICNVYGAMGMPWWGSCGASTAVACAVISSIT
ncbi:hypothetical protein [Chryseobacterium sp. Leaf201]|uniref:hypothetical protein n=1 Tax=Chryseobacterium sp. Leaf201 TaxID=1735672 RepID=UPI000AC5D85E|nr:hypothetical protein [Chryseobacterium sp. Leaf201]